MWKNNYVISDACKRKCFFFFRFHVALTNAQLILYLLIWTNRAQLLVRRSSVRFPLAEAVAASSLLVGSVLVQCII